MKLRIKIMLSFLCLLSFLFGCAGSALISISFQESMSREQDSVKKSYSLLLNTLKIIGDINAWSDSVNIADTLNSLSAQDGTTWSALLLSSDSEILFKQGDASENLKNLVSSGDTGHLIMSSFTGEGGQHYIQLSSVLSIGSEPYRLDAAYDVSQIYEAREKLEQIYSSIFLLTVICCALLSYFISRILMRPLARLSQTAMEISSGNLASRALITSQDEIGSLAFDFNKMADQVEGSICELTESLHRQELFMGGFAHELKTPMTSIIGYADLLRNGLLDPAEQAEAAQYIFSEGKRLESLSLKLLDILAADGKNIELTSCSPGKIIKELVKILKPIYHTDGVALYSRCDEGNYMLDSDLFRSLILNLLDNAKKISPPSGRILISCRVSPRYCRIIVLDEGSGIPEEAMPHLTEAFYRADPSRSRASGGTGLGLTLCAKIAALHNGILQFLPRNSKGTKVIVTLKGGQV